MLKNILEINESERDQLHEEFENLEYKDGCPATYLLKDKKGKYFHSDIRKKWSLFIQQKGYEL
ncbi:hypothetical protein [Yersinia intermedia]|uniref:Uncharacterized protein n=1 Tax=Yersinia intermedia TaxID=631 RepID=A0ABX6F744_YERIN|nr:hypothetical protein [Yersinia intermedia]QGR65318.1 hypothetical protein FOC38_04755 [Yersinia intermedia]QGR70335.1 hypothetical protein FOC37_08060 [Yersinia intermedia]CRY83040.1 Uncharacterised protein [Yersinia intermedia]